MAKIGGLWALLCLVFAQVIAGIDVDWTSDDSIKAAASTVAYDLMTYYHGNKTGGTPGLLDWPDYYWWEAGGMFGTLVDYWHYTGDTSYNQVTMNAMQWQVGPDNDFMPPNQTFSLGNDDQAFWAMAALAAAEYNFPNPPAGDPSWLGLAQAVFNEQVQRWDNTTCGGGIHWQIYSTNTGFPLKNSISNGCLFNIASRLARYTANDMYAQWAIKIWDWMWAVQLIDENYNVYDNSDSNLNCTQVQHIQWSYNAATMLMGASTMYNYTNGDPVWENRTTNLLSTMLYDYFPNGTMKDICEENNACDTDQKSFKAYVARWMTASAQMAPFIYPNVSSVLLSTAKAAAAQCTGLCGADPKCAIPNGQVCGLKWYNDGVWDGTNGAGQQMSVLAALISTLSKPNDKAQVPLTNATGGTSTPNPTAGKNSTGTTPLFINPATKKDKTGAWFLTVLISLFSAFMIVFLVTEAWERGDSTVNGKRKRASRNFASSAAKSGPGMISGLVKWNSRDKDKGKGKEVFVAPGQVQAPVPPPVTLDQSRRLSKRASGYQVGKTHPLSTVTLPSGESGEGSGSGSPEHSSEALAHGAVMEREDLDMIQEAERRKSTPIYKGGDLPT